MQKNHYLATDTWRELQAKLANVRPLLGDPDLMTAVAIILDEFGILPEYCRGEEEHPYLRRRNFA